MRVVDSGSMRRKPVSTMEGSVAQQTQIKKFRYPRRSWIQPLTMPGAQVMDFKQMKLKLRSAP